MNSHTCQTGRRIFAHNGSNDADSSKDVLLWVSLKWLPFRESNQLNNLKLPKFPPIGNRGMTTFRIVGQAVKAANSDDSVHGRRAATSSGDVSHTCHGSRRLWTYSITKCPTFTLHGGHAAARATNWRDWVAPRSVIYRSPANPPSRTQRTGHRQPSTDTLWPCDRSTAVEVPFSAAGDKWCRFMRLSASQRASASTESHTAQTGDGHPTAQKLHDVSDRARLSIAFYRRSNIVVSR